MHNIALIINCTNDTVKIADYISNDGTFSPSNLVFQDHFLQQAYGFVKHCISMYTTIYVHVKLPEWNKIKWKASVWDKTLHETHHHTCTCTSRNLSSYTERQKTHHFFGGTLTNMHHIKINHIWTQISYSSHELWSTSEKWKGCLCKKLEQCGEIAKCNLSKITKGRLFRRFNSYYCDFWKMSSCDFTLFYYFFTQSNVCFLRCAL